LGKYAVIILEFAFESPPPLSFIRRPDSKIVGTKQGKKMKKQVFLCLCCALLALTTVSAKEYHTNHFTIYSDLNPLYVQFIQANAEAYYANVHPRYFKKGWEKPRLKIYYSRTQSDTQNLLEDHGYYTNVDRGCYEPSAPAVYTHQFMNNGEINGWDALFHEIACHFVHQNFKNTPQWFEEGLTLFLGDQARIIRGELIVVEPNPKAGQILKSRIDERKRFNIKALFATTNEMLYRSRGRCQFAQVFFYWLNETEQLHLYLENARQKGYEFSVLEETLATSFGKINKEFADFIEANCHAAARLHDARQAEDHAQRQQAFLNALQLKPDHHAARLELAKSYNLAKDYENCRKHVKQILNAPQSAEFLQAASLMARTYYDQQDYTNALEYYSKAWEYSGCYEYKYKLAYRIGNCYYRLENPECATKWYKEFLDCNWEPDKNEAIIDYTRKYVESADTAQADCPKKY
jgi:tetratricopeptide (TPR) repeat protein